MKGKTWDIAIVGSGPAGTSAAISIARIDPKLASRTVVLEAGSVAREKICAGCVTGRSWGLLKKHGISVDVPTIAVNAVRFMTALGDMNLPRPNVGAIVRRGEFDSALAQVARREKIEILEHRRVLNARRFDDMIELTTSGPKGRELHKAKIVIGADGATSVVRKQLARNPRKPIRTLMYDVPVPKSELNDPTTLVFDFRPVENSLRGYRWIFPAFGPRGEKSMTVGICDFDPNSHTPIEPLLDAIMQEHGIDPSTAEARYYPFYTFNEFDPLGGPGWLLTGEAAGSDNLLAEGISYGIESGVLAAEFAVESLKSGDLSMSGYTSRFHWSRVGKELRTLWILAAMFYSPLHMRMLRAGLFNEELCAIGGEILAGEIEPRTKVALRIGANLFKTMFTQAVSPK